MRHLLQTYVLGAIMLFMVQPVCAMNTPAQKTFHGLKELYKAFYFYHEEFGSFPSTEQGCRELKSSGIWPTIPLDAWKQPFVYRMPGKHGDYDLYSCGPDGIDNDGNLDDISNWAGVNDGYHWKQDWPQGRFVIVFGPVLGLVSLLLAFVYPWRIIAPFAGSIVCLGIFYGSGLLNHPTVPYYEQLMLSGQIAFFSLLALIVYLVVTVWKQGLITKREQRQRQLHEATRQERLHTIMKRRPFPQHRRSLPRNSPAVSALMRGRTRHCS